MKIVLLVRHCLALLGHGCLAALLLMWSGVVQAELRIEGGATYQVLDANSVRITADRVSNNADNYISGTLYLQLWATADADPIGEGFVLGQAQLGELQPNQYFHSIDYTVSYAAPPDGTYFVHLILVEYPNLGTIVSSVSFGQEVFSGGGGGGDDVALEGFGGYQVNGSNVEISIDEVVNYRNSTTGTLYLKLWATTGTSHVGSGYELAALQLGQLGPNQFYANIQQSVAFTAPPAGTYYMHLILVEFPNTNTVLSHMSFGPQTFGGSGGGGGGGTLGNNISVPVSGGTGSGADYFFDAPGPGTLTVTLAPTGSWSGDPDLVVGNNLCSSNLGAGLTDSCQIAVPSAARYLINVQGYTAYSGYTLTASFSSAGGGGGALYLDGTVSYDIANGNVRLRADRVINSSSTVTTGTLYLKLWATTGSSPAGNGYELASLQLGQLGPNQQFQNIDATVTFSPPPNGTYFLHLLLVQFPEMNSYVSAITFNSTESFSSNNDGGNDGGGGGGGSFAPSLLLLVALGARRWRPLVIGQQSMRTVLYRALARYRQRAAARLARTFRSMACWRQRPLRWPTP